MKEKKASPAKHVKTYSLLELGAWIHLLVRKAEITTDNLKRAKCLSDARACASEIVRRIPKE